MSLRAAKRSRKNVQVKLAGWSTRPLGPRAQRLLPPPVAEASMVDALSALDHSKARVRCHLKRPRVDWKEGKFQERFVSLPPDTKLVQDGTINPDLRNAQAARISVETTDEDDGGAAIFNLGKRQVELVSSSTQISELANAVHGALHRHPAKWFRRLYAVPEISLALILASFITVVLVDVTSEDARIYRACIATNSSTCGSQPVYLDTVYKIVAYVILAGIIALLMSLPIILTLKRANTSLNVLPRDFSVRRLLEAGLTAFAQGRSELQLFQLIKTFFKWAIPMLIAAIIGAWMKSHFG